MVCESCWSNIDVYILPDDESSNPFCGDASRICLSIMFTKIASNCLATVLVAPVGSVRAVCLSDSNPLESSARRLVRSVGFIARFPCLAPASDDFQVGAQRIGRLHRLQDRDQVLRV